MMSPWPRAVLHADMDAFYASVEQRDRPELRGKAVAVGGRAGRGVVCAASYEARPSGVRSAMPTSRALQLCPELILISPRMAHYADVSREIFKIFRRFTPLVEPLSLDEAFLDLSGTESLLGPPVEVARRLRREVQEELELTVSVGVAPNKFIAKVASDLEKPDGLTVVAPDCVESFLRPLPVSRMWGIGKVAQGALAREGIHTIGELAELSEEKLKTLFGSRASQLWRLARGQDERPVVPDREPKSVGHESTFERDTRSIETLRAALCQQADSVATRLRRRGLWARTVTVKVKHSDFRLQTKQTKLKHPSRDGFELAQVGCALLQEFLPFTRGVRLVGISASELARQQGPSQLALGEDPHVETREKLDREKLDREKLGAALDSIEDRFGKGTIGRATGLTRLPKSSSRTQSPLQSSEVDRRRPAG